MAKRPTITTITSGYNSTAQLNANLVALRNAFDNTLSLDGSTPNAMGADLDMNNNNILNLNELEVAELTIGGNSVAASVAAAAASAAAASTSETNAAASAAAAAVSASNIDPSTYLVRESNLSDIPDPAAALGNLGVTATAAELNVLDGITATTAELNILDGVTATATEINRVGQLPGRNRLINGGFTVAQRGTNFAGGTKNADDTYTLDRWYVLSAGSDTVDVDQIADSPDMGGKCIRLDVETTGQKFGIAQIIEATNCTGLIGNTVTLSFAAKVSNARLDTIKAAIVSWSGTADTVTSDIVSAWNGAGTTPSLIANATFENTPADLGVTTDWATYTITADVDTSSAANVIVFIWSDNATNPLAGDFLYVTNVQLEVGDTATPFEHRSYGQELALCQRYYQFQGDAGNRFVFNGPGTSEQYVMSLFFKEQMRVSPAINLTFTFVNGSGGGILAQSVDGFSVSFLGIGGIGQHGAYVAWNAAAEL